MTAPELAQRIALYSQRARAGLAIFDGRRPSAAERRAWLAVVRRLEEAWSPRAPRPPRRPARPVVVGSAGLRAS